MKLTEVAPDFVRSQTGVLMTILRHLEDKMGKGTTVPLSRVAKLMNNVGYSFGYDDLKDIYDNNPQISELISNFNEKELTVGEKSDTVTSDEPDANKVVDKLAQKAAKKINQ